MKNLLQPFSNIDDTMKIQRKPAHTHTHTIILKSSIEWTECLNMHSFRLLYYGFGAGETCVVNGAGFYYFVLFHRLFSLTSRLYIVAKDKDNDSRFKCKMSNRRVLKSQNRRRRRKGRTKDRKRMEGSGRNWDKWSWEKKKTNGTKHMTLGLHKAWIRF